MRPPSRTTHSFAFFGSRSRVAGITYRVQGSLHRSVNQEDERSVELIVAYDRVSDRLRRPPSGVKPVSNLIEASDRLFGEVEVTCNATFEYDAAQGYRSAMHLPIALIVPESTEGITHIEAARFSRRVGDDVEYRIAISTDDTGSFMHQVGFERRVHIGRSTLAELLSIAESISTQLIVRTGAEKDAGD